MKNLTKPIAAITIFLAIACKKEETVPAPIIINTPTIVKTDTIKIVKTDSVVLQGSDVLYSDWLSPIVPSTPTNPTGTGTGTNPGNGSTGTQPTTPINIRYFTVSAPAITQTILDKGVILAYCRLSDDNNMTRALATTTFVSGYFSIWDFALSVGKIQFIQTSANPNGIPAISSSHKFRYVIIPPTRHVRLSKPLTQMTYEEVCDLYNIPK